VGVQGLAVAEESVFDLPGVLLGLLFGRSLVKLVLSSIGPCLEVKFERALKTVYDVDMLHWRHTLVVKELRLLLKLPSLFDSRHGRLCESFGTDRQCWGFVSAFIWDACLRETGWGFYGCIMRSPR